MPLGVAKIELVVPEASAVGSPIYFPLSKVDGMNFGRRRSDLSYMAACPRTITLERGFVDGFVNRKEGCPVCRF